LIGIGTFSGPTVSAFVVTAVSEGREGVVQLLRRIVQWRVGIAWYLFAFIGLPAIETLGTIAIPGVLASATSIDWLTELMSAAVFFVYPGLLAGPLGEEIGWRGFALPRLQRLQGPVKASLILGVLWAFWHAPIWFSGQWSTPSVPNIAVYVFWIVAVTFIFTWVFNNSQGSVFMAILLHGTMDVFPNAFLLAHLPGAAEMTSSGVLSIGGWRSASACSRCCSLSAREAGWATGSRADFFADVCRLRTGRPAGALQRAVVLTSRHPGLIQIGRVGPCRTDRW
jgi:membrane protease YdiL (CAAX protease family)